jgi:pentatricopeptide repeat protein
MIHSVLLGWFLISFLLGQLYVAAFMDWRVVPNKSPDILCTSTGTCGGARVSCWKDSAIYLSQQQTSFNEINRTRSKSTTSNRRKNNYNTNPSFEKGRRNRKGSFEHTSSTKAANRSSWSEIDRLPSKWEIDNWVRRRREESYFSDWTFADQIAFVKLLQGRRAFKAILYFLDSLSYPNVKVCTTAMFSMALSSNHRHEALGILDLMDRLGVSPTSLTFIALLGSIDGPSAASWMMARFERYKGVKMTAEVYNSAIYACRRVAVGSRPDDNDWQVALRLLQQMRSKRIQPTTKTFHAMLQVLSRTGKVSMAMALLQQMQNTPHLKPDDFVWAAAINVCAQAADYRGAIKVINDMQTAGFRPNLRHCSALIKAFVKSGQDDLALLALEMMVGSSDTEDPSNPFRLPIAAPDIIALNTVVAACAKSHNYEAAMSIYERMKAGEFQDPINNKVIAPDIITHHSMLIACSNPEDARQIVKEVRHVEGRAFSSFPKKCEADRSFP